MGMRQHPLAKMLKSRHVSLRHFASSLGISPSHLSRVLRGERRLGMDAALRISKALGVSLEEIVRCPR